MNIESNIRLGKLFLILLHLVLLYVGFLAAYGVYEALSSTNDLLINHQLILITSLVAIVSFNLFDLYSSWKRKSIKNLVYSIVLALSTVCLINLGISWFSVVPLSSGLVLLAFAFQLFFVGGMHIPLWSIQKKNHGLKKVLIIGEDKGEDAGLAKKILKHQPGWFLVHGYTNVKNKNLTKSDLSVVDAVLISQVLLKIRKRKWSS
ncbi:hypothetical protein [Thalassobacillus sp. C254]|uniref:hypothetical protein n=1 Tax=Thalassobacillus sp. C254 TaxID=1225341 RepID=UPI0006CFF39F|nr:hypothetical protein [Thalassobacillus sp. C254]